MNWVSWLRQHLGSTASWWKGEEEVPVSLARAEARRAEILARQRMLERQRDLVRRDQSPS